MSEELFSEAIQLRDCGQLRKGIKRIFSVVNDWLWEGDFNRCDETLRTVDVNRLGVDLSLSFLTITFHAHELLIDSRSLLHARLFDKIAKEEGASRARQLLRNREIWRR